MLIKFKFDPKEFFSTFSFLNITEWNLTARLIGQIVFASHIILFDIYLLGIFREYWNYSCSIEDIRDVVVWLPQRLDCGQNKVVSSYSERIMHFENFAVRWETLNWNPWLAAISSGSRQGRSLSVCKWFRRSVNGS